MNSRQSLLLRPAVLAVGLVLLPLALSLAAPPGAVKDGCEITIAPDHADGVYRAGETMTFVVRVTRDGKPVTSGEVQYRIVINGTEEQAKGSAALAADGATVRTKLAQPGCLTVAVSYSLGEKSEIKAETGAAADPGRIQPSLPAPEDFDTFWAAQKKRLADMPMNPRLTPVEMPNVPWAADVECFDLQADCPGGAPLSGYFARPKGAKPKSCPAWISFHGAGAHSSNLIAAAGRAKHRGMLGMDINAHGSPNGKPDQYYADLLTGELKGYSFKGMDSRETFYFLGMYLRLMRAMEFLCSQPEWDGRTLIATGSSQGGAQALVAAGLDSRVTLISAGLPALCDITGSAAGRAAGWPIGTRKLSDAELRTLRYFDVAHLAAHSRATAVVRVGLIDHTCWPAGVFAACNQLKGMKHILVAPDSGHTYTPPEVYRQASQEFDEVLAQTLRPDGTK